MKWNKSNLFKVVLGLFFLFFIGWVLFSERQSEEPYKVTGEELLRIKDDCRGLAKQKETYENRSNPGSNQLTDYGYSEYRGYCYAEVIQSYGSEDKSKVVYNTTEGKEVFRREWPKDIDWYNYDFDRIVLGKKRIIDFRAPW